LEKLKKAWCKLILISVALTFLLLSPVFYEIYYQAYYYTLVILISPLPFLRIFYERKLDEVFYRKWEKQRRWGFWPNMILGSITGLVFLVVFVSAGQFFGRGITPVDVVERLSGGPLVGVVLMMVVFAVILGVVGWYENENRFSRIYYNRKYGS